MTSDRNSVEAHLNLFDELDCQIILTTNPPVPAVEAILAERKMRLVSIPPIEELLSTTYPKYPYCKDFQASQNDLAFICHTSGTTGEIKSSSEHFGIVLIVLLEGFPQPRCLTHGYIARAGRNIRLEAPVGFQMLSSMTGNNRNALLLPVAHVSRSPTQDRI